MDDKLTRKSQEALTAAVRRAAAEPQIEIRVSGLEVGFGLVLGIAVHLNRGSPHVPAGKARHRRNSL